MRLSKENSRRLTISIWRERLRTWGPGVIVAVALVVGFLYVQAEFAAEPDRVVETKVHKATVVAFEGAMGRRGAMVRVHLDDGRDVDATSALTIFPANGSHLVVNEFKRASGQLSFNVVRLESETGK